MENEPVKKSAAGKIVLISVAAFIGAFLLYFSIMTIQAPARKLAEVSKEIAEKQTEGSVVDERKFSDSLYMRLLRDKSFLQSRIAMAGTDSIYLTINLADSTSNIEISGVVVHKVKMSEFSTSKMLRKGDEKIILSLLSAPFNIERDWATIRKEPVMIKMAPRDTSEYKPDIIPDTSLVEPVNYILEMTNGARIYIYQEEEETAGDRMSIFMFDLKDRVRSAKSSLKSVLRFEVPEYHPYIKIRIPRADAKIIYRALPRYGQVGIYR